MMTGERALEWANFVKGTYRCVPNRCRALISEKGKMAKRKESFQGCPLGPSPWTNSPFGLTIKFSVNIE
jgi:hypothetical protein